MLCLNRHPGRFGGFVCLVRRLRLPVHLKAELALVGLLPLSRRVLIGVDRLRDFVEGGPDRPAA